MTLGNLLTEWSRLLVASLRQAGIQNIVISPGSRSTPLVCAALEHPGLSVCTLIDERCAGFYALGHAKVTGQPVALLCTSGTAPAHYFPAVIEASESETPLVVVSADRPFEVQEARAAQTIDQTTLFGRYCRGFFELGMPDPEAFIGLQRIAALAVLRSQTPRPGPVHLNVRARKPLEPAEALTPDERALSAEVDRRIARGVALAPVPRTVARPDALEPMAARLAESERCLIVVGPAPIHARLDVARFARAARAVVSSDVASQLRFRMDPAEAPLLDALNVLLRAGCLDEELRPDLIVEIGCPPVSNDYERYVDKHPDITRLVLAERGWPDPHGTAAGVITGDLRESLRMLSERLELDPRRQGPWVEAAKVANLQAWQALSSGLASSEHTALTEAVAVQSAVQSIPKGGLLCLGNSLPIREVDSYCPSRPRSIQVWHQRGANGIDGLVSGAAGAATAAASPTLLLIGDVSFLHDVGGLEIARRATTPLVMVVVDNGGGRIFDLLPVTRVVSAERLAHWTTPHRLPLERAAALYEIPAVTAKSLPELDAGLTAAWQRPGASVVVARVAPGIPFDELDRAAMKLRIGRVGCAR